MGEMEKFWGKFLGKFLGKIGNKCQEITVDVLIQQTLAAMAAQVGFCHIIVETLSYDS